MLRYANSHFFSLLAVIFLLDFAFSWRDALERETWRMNQRIYRPKKKTNARGSCMQMQISEGIPEFHWEAFRCAFPRCGNESLLRYASPEAQLFDSKVRFLSSLSRLSKILRPSEILKSRKVTKEKAESNNSQLFPKKAKIIFNFVTEFFCTLNSI